MAQVGDRVELSAAGSTDPDGDSLSYHWFYYPEAGTFNFSSARSGNPLRIEHSDSVCASFVVPRAGRLGTMHLIVAVTDHGTPALTRYERVIVTVGKPRVLISTDIGGTDADDNQSMAHLLMYNDRFDLEGLVSSPSFGNGSKAEIMRMIDLYEEDYPQLRQHQAALLPPESLRKLCKQGRKGGAPWAGYDTPTEGSEWIVKCARSSDDRPLWLLVWGALDDVAQALHDAPEIASHIRVYWIGGPNKKWGCNAYTYIAQQFPDLWIIENNSTYRGFIGDNKQQGEWQNGYYDAHIREAGHLGADFINYYAGNIKMGDTPSLLYMMNGNPDTPTSAGWGGTFEPMKYSPYRIYSRPTTLQDSLPIYGIFELRLPLPKKYNKNKRPEVPFKLTIARQEWEATYCDGYASVRYAPKEPATLHYEIHSDIKDFDGLQGDIVVTPLWPGFQPSETDIPVGNNWYTDVAAPSEFHGIWQGYNTCHRWREEVLRDWAKRWDWLKPQPQSAH